MKRGREGGREAARWEEVGRDPEIAKAKTRTIFKTMHHTLDFRIPGVDILSFLMTSGSQSEARVPCSPWEDIDFRGVKENIQASK